MKLFVFHGNYLVLFIITYLFFLCCNVLSQEKYDYEKYQLPTISQIKILSPQLESPSPLPKTEIIKWSPKPYFHNNESEFIRLHIVVKDLPKKNTWELQILTLTGDIVETLNSQSFISCGENCLEKWSDFIDGNAFQLKLIDQGDSEQLKIIIDKYMYESREPGSVSIIPPFPPDLRDLALSFSTDSKYRKFGKQVGMITFPKNGKETPCSGVFLTTKHFVTNHHCINDNTKLEDVRIWLDYVTNATVKRVKITKLLISDKNLDFSILELENPVSTSEVAVFDLSPINKVDLIVIQHPNGERKKITIDGCKVDKIEVEDRKTDFFHLCDTDGGSSGSPVMKLNGAVIGLHHFGMEKPTPRNLAVKFQEIIKKIQVCNPDLYKQIVAENATLKITQ